MEKQIEKDLTEIFDEEYGKRRLITPQFTAKRLVEKGYRKQSETAREIFEEITKHMVCTNEEDFRVLDELKKKYTEADNGKEKTD